MVHFLTLEADKLKANHICANHINGNTTPGIYSGNNLPKNLIEPKNIKTRQPLNIDRQYDAQIIVSDIVLNHNSCSSPSFYRAYVNIPDNLTIIGHSVSSILFNKIITPSHAEISGNQLTILNYSIDSILNRTVSLILYVKPNNIV